MSYKKAKQKRDKARKKHDKAKQALKDAEANMEQAQQAVEDTYEDLTETMAKHEAGDCSKSDCENAKKAHQQAKQAVEDAQLTLDAKRKAVSVFEDKAKQAHQQYLSEAKKHYEGEAEPLAERMIETLQQLEQVNEDVKSFRKEMTENGLNPDKYISPAFEEIKLPVKHLRRNHDLKMWKQNLPNQ